MTQGEICMKIIRDNKEFELDAAEINMAAKEELMRQFDAIMRKSIEESAKQRSINLTPDMLSKAYEECFDKLITYLNSSIIDGTIDNCTYDYFLEKHLEHHVLTFDILSLEDKECDEWGLAEVWNAFEPEKGVELNISREILFDGTVVDNSAIYKCSMKDGVKVTDYSTYVPYKVETKDERWYVKLVVAMNRIYNQFYC